ncbi:acyl-CoA thioesterase II [Novosphingobium marinum]|uniref:Acyl-CoA thioesterase-2 n=1 Tax=Novosphingobium marinum TaxID=1514948 RepID=A0A7Y9XYC4_9SPHN|nr:acyl-CoA thioesterase domain-containing protein [Novosphingobium marinum]NYH95281.1 acyl-CoA thioesterase-2 [Novosphingobium marinum]GGC25798.1 acyl-CoA thioesterase II [Novosphingobium marinum]
MRRFDQRIFDRRWELDIVDLLALEDVGQDRFVAPRNQPNAYGTLYGGQIAAQALTAADRTVPEGRKVHSLHSYFLRAGDNDKRVDYDVERTRDGGRFSTRRVTASQQGRIIFSMECSYRSGTHGFSHFREQHATQSAEDALAPEDIRAMVSEEHASFLGLFAGNYPVELRLPGTAGYFETAPEAKRHYWLRAPGAGRVSDPAVHRQIFTFLSDFMLVGVPLVPHTVALPGPHLFVASLDHNVWFHRDIRCDEWLLFETEGPNAHEGVNLAQGHVYDTKGVLVATVAQEALQIPQDGDQE